LADDLFTKGVQITASGNNAVNVPSAADSSVNLWTIFPNLWGVTQGSGTAEVAYQPGATNGAITATINMTGLNTGPVVAYPFIFYGGDPYDDSILGQGEVWPEQLSMLSQVLIQTNYSLNLLSQGLNVDVLYDMYLIPTSGFTGGLGGAEEVEVLPFYSFTSGAICGGSQYFVKTISFPNCSINGAPGCTFDEYFGSNGGSPPGAGGVVLFCPHVLPGLQSGTFQADFLPIMNEAAATGQLNGWWLAGLEFGSEFGGASSVNYTLTVKQMLDNETVLVP
jgi:hypothetical protein